MILTKQLRQRRQLVRLGRVLQASITDPFRTIRQFIVRTLRVSRRRVQILVTEDLSQPNQVVGVVGQVLVTERVPQEVRMQAHTDDRGVFAAQPPHAAFGQWPALTDEHAIRCDRGPGFQIGGQCLAGQERQRHRALFIALS